MCTVTFMSIPVLILIQHTVVSFQDPDPHTEEGSGTLRAIS